MIEKILQKLTQLIFVPKLRRIEKKIGYKLLFHHIPDRYINGLVEWDETATWQKFGLNLEAGANYWTIGKIAHGVSSRFDRNAPEYQSWLGGYLVKLSIKEEWSVEDHFKLAIADQNGWLGSYGDPNPMTTIEGWKFIPIGTIHAGNYSGTLYEAGCTTHSDVGDGFKNISLAVEAIGIAALFNAYNPQLRLKGGMMRPTASVHSYETLKLPGYIAIFDVEELVKVVLYADGAMAPKENGSIDTFPVLKNDLRKAMESCEIIKVR